MLEMTAMPMVCDLSCASQRHMKMQGFSFKGQEKLPKALKYKLISFFFFLSSLKHSWHFPLVFWESEDLHKHTWNSVLQLSVCVFLAHQL